MANGRIRKDVLHRTVGRPHLSYEDTCKRDMKMAGIDINSWDRGNWRSVVKNGIKREKIDVRLPQIW